ncbi:P-loop containing nucleoside triphosphate hydrolase protein [Terfezia boudieri ATCC MYA-4762]|uniref:P-loop containing nucleoside triphosphate hydrolase protein n=1 Tax=Terfezia boudieri ATCC MYA-4762 TaxID=1051890 RepID=A0A3N4LGC0_9PEZI|nr:P-loop containing nucleoside triphosphate hydrolase protein [Terfezia boudieri ATCC MYA-4762]
MYHLVKGLYQYATSKEEYSVLLLGLDNAGKTTLLEQIKSIYLPSSPSPSPGHTPPTVGQNTSYIPFPDLTLKLWDIGGQHSLRRLWSSYYTSSHAIVFVIDSADPERLLSTSEVQIALEEVVKNEDVEGVPILVLANKQDREEAVEIAKVKEVVLAVLVGLGARDSRVLPISALEGRGVREAVEWLRTRVKWNREARPPVLR